MTSLLGGFTMFVKTTHTKLCNLLTKQLYNNTSVGLQQVIIDNCNTGKASVPLSEASITTKYILQILFPKEATARFYTKCCIYSDYAGSLLVVALAVSRVWWSR